MKQILFKTDGLIIIILLKRVTCMSQEYCCFIGQLCAEVITQYLYPYKKCSCRVVAKLSNKFRQGTLHYKLLFFSVILAGMA